MDPNGLEVIKTTLPSIVDGAKQTLGKLLGPAIEETGLLLQDGVRTFRFQNQVRTLNKTQEMLDKAGISPKSVPLKVLVPLLDGASLEDDEEMTEKWAALLANGADPNQKLNVLPGFPDILKQLTSVDALILRECIDVVHENDSFREQGFDQFILVTHLLDELNVDIRSSELSFDNLIRLGIIERWVDGEEAIKRVEDRLENQERNSRSNSSSASIVASVRAYWNRGLRSKSTSISKRKIRLTALGYEFYKACQPPGSMKSSRDY